MTTTLPGEDPLNLRPAELAAEVCFGLRGRLEKKVPLKRNFSWFHRLPNTCLEKRKKPSIRAGGTLTNVIDLERPEGPHGSPDSRCLSDLE